MPYKISFYSDTPQFKKAIQIFNMVPTHTQYIHNLNILFTSLTWRFIYFE